MEIEHPAAKMMVDIAKTQENEVGDGTTTAVMLAGKLLENAEKLLDMKIHPTVIIKGYKLASKEAERILNEMAVKSDNVNAVDESQRQTLHLAAVFANNFTNHIYSIAEKILVEKRLSFDDLRPLIASHIQNVLAHSPSELQTGPAIRGDQSTLDIHMDLLKAHPDYKEIYSLLTTSIQDIHKTK